MNARQRRLRRRLVAPAVLTLISACDQAAKAMRETGEPLTPEDCESLASGLREMLKANPDWQRVARRAA